jgi:cyclase
MSYLRVLVVAFCGEDTVKYLCIVALLLGSSISSFAADNIFQIKRVADGVYAAIATRTFRINCNAVIVLMDNGVLVVDAESTPSAAREIIAGIKQLTDKPVQYVVITHFHGDHFQGTEAYVQTWPSVQIISSEATRDGIATMGASRLEREILELPARIDKLKTDLQQAKDPQTKDQIKTSLSQAQAYYIEVKNLHVVLPTLLVDHKMIFQGKTRTVEILRPGRAHTEGDLFVYVPDAKVIATGDALHSGAPTLTDASPFDWIRTLDAVEKLDFQTVIGGHGDVIQGKGTFDLWKQYLAELMEDAVKANSQGETLDEARKTLAPPLIAKYGSKFGDMPWPFSETVDSNINRAFRIVSGPARIDAK